MKNTLTLLFTLFLSVLVFSSCAKKKAKEQANTDEKIIKQYITDHNLTAIPTGTGLYYVIENQGNGGTCNSFSTVRVSYKGYLTDGSVFDESEVEGISFGLQEVIKGWTEGIPYFKEGGNGKLLIPSALGYGKQGNSGIPANSVLIFDVKLIEIH